MSSRTRQEIGAGDRVVLPRSGHSCGAGERATVVAVLGTVLRVRRCDGRETFVPRSLVARQGEACAKTSISA